MNDLIQAVETGTWDGSWRRVLDAHKLIPPQAFSDAYHGSLDAAMKVHQALLPEWPMMYINRYSRDPHRWSVELADLGKLAPEPRRSLIARGECPARTLLLAALRVSAATAV